MKRIVAFDFLRGFLLTIIVINHSPFSIRQFTEESIGFVSAAEGFVFLSAFLSGMVFALREDRKGFDFAAQRARERAWRIYLSHLAVVLFGLVLATLWLPDLPGLTRSLGPLREDPLAASAAAMLLLFQPALMDILPMYILFAVLTPCAFWVAKRCGWSFALVGALLLWVFAQYGLRNFLFRDAAPHSFINPGMFDVFAWQLLWLVGLWLGQRFQRAQPLRWSIPHASLAIRTVLLTVVVVLLAIRWLPGTRDWAYVNAAWWVDKWTLGPLRLLDFAGVAWLVSLLLGRLERWEKFLRPFTLIGRHILPVFCTQICLSVLLNGISHHLPAAPGLLRLYLLSQLALAFTMAGWLEKRALERRRLAECLALAPAH